MKTFSKIFLLLTLVSLFSCVSKVDKNFLQNALVPDPPTQLNCTQSICDQSVEINLTMLDGVNSFNGVVSFGVPFSEGQLLDSTKLKVTNDQGVEIPIQTKVLAYWPKDNSLRSVLVLLNLSTNRNSIPSLYLSFKGRTLNDLSGLVANPDGDLSALLSSSWYSKSRVVYTPLATFQENTDFASFDSQSVDNLFNEIDWDDYSVNCSSTTSHRSYYDSVHAMYSLFMRGGEERVYRKAREEVKIFIQSELVKLSNDTMAIHVCQANASSWTPSTKLSWSILRRMVSEGLLSDYLITGDENSKLAIEQMGEAIIQNIPALKGGENTFLVTERNLAWPIHSLVNLYSIKKTIRVKNALDELLTIAINWQDSSSGAFEHDINRPDPSECGDGPSGASPFMTTILIDALMNAYYLTGDVRIPPVVLKTANWFKNHAVTTNNLTFQYLWNCNDRDYLVAQYYDINLMMVHVFGAAYALSFDKSWLTLGDSMATKGLEDAYLKRPKQWNQANRTFGKYLGYRNL